MAKTKKKYEDFEIQYVYKQFVKVMSKCIKKNHKEKIDELFEDVVKRYSAKGRHYHNMKHLFDVVYLLNVYQESIVCKEEIFLAAIYHDIIYNPKRTDNEIKSADFFLKKICPLLKLDEDGSGYVYTAIFATTHKDVEWITNKDIQLLLDIDLSILGTNDPEAYERYRVGVRKEYKMYSDEQYNEGRTNVLKSFIHKKKIYLTKEFKKTEKKARKNLQNEINSYIC